MQKKESFPRFRTICADKAPSKAIGDLLDKPIISASPEGNRCFLSAILVSIGAISVGQIHDVTSTERVRELWNKIVEEIAVDLSKVMSVKKKRRIIKPGETAYKIPYGGLFRFVTSPNYLGEFIEWVGWAILTWSFSGAIFAFWTFANLLPRAFSHHKWYLDRFPDYPKDRKRMIPFLL
ncbi:3-oxo-5-alpha-steroid 4-dehydrogenase/very-long-chain enoyl-CoA reductase like protein [Aduncisulcus paluster]|uniref:3-oxo-5-alpha-steroid 4-dehydrogenase/very-long-chain enoyl-CoA reductase like protein n=1 Tax=Aduncisulcus paluster TaxID=2918883 RepID=A0ABQ5K0A8_9EUKA|nr:3-oxo-5-alpha-steroid 4-dehydrogenase/very-long-chain enoyl-CoA reductase like protein [Aduncisulcus paluster]